MPKREVHTASDIAQLAVRFRETWREGQVLRSWLKSHATEIRELVRERDWSWENLGRALTEAGITYQTGAPWTGENLRRNLNRAEVPGKRELKLRRMVQPEPGPPDLESPLLGGAAAAPTGFNGKIAGVPVPNAPEFQIIRRAADKGAAPLEMASLPPKRPRPALTEAEIDAIVVGRSARR